MHRNYVFNLVLATICMAFASHVALAADPGDLLSEEDVNLQAIRTFFEAAFIKAEFDKDGDLKIMDEGMRTFVKVDKDKKLISYFTAWNMKASVPEIKKLQLVNEFNDGLIFARFSMPNSTTLWCDYQLLYDGGVTPYAIVSNYKLFSKVVKGAVATRDPEDIIGSD